MDIPCAVYSLISCHVMSVLMLKTNFSLCSHSFTLSSSILSPLICLLFPSQVHEFSQVLCMLPWAYTMSGFTLCHKVCSIATVHLTKCLYISTHCICLFGIWGIMPSFTSKLGRQAYITMVCSLSCCYVGQHVPSALSVGSGGISHDEDLHFGCQAMPLVIMDLTAYL